METMFQIYMDLMRSPEMAYLVCLVDDVTASASIGWGTLAQPVERNQYVTGPQVASAPAPAPPASSTALVWSNRLVTSCQ